MISGRKGEHRKILDDAKRSGFVRVRVNGEIRSLDEEIDLDKNRKHSLEVVVDRLTIEPRGAETAVGIGGDRPWRWRPAASPP